MPGAFSDSARNARSTMRGMFASSQFCNCGFNRSTTTSSRLRDAAAGCTSAAVSFGFDARGAGAGTRVSAVAEGAALGTSAGDGTGFTDGAAALIEAADAFTAFDRAMALANECMVLTGLPLGMSRISGSSTDEACVVAGAAAFPSGADPEASDFNAEKSGVRAGRGVAASITVSASGSTVTPDECASLRAGCCARPGAATKLESGVSL